VTELLPRGQEPARECRAADLSRVELPVQLQRYPVRADGTLALSPEEAALLVARSPDRFSVSAGGHALTWTATQRGDRDPGDAAAPVLTVASFPLGWDADGWARFVTRLPLAREEARLERENEGAGAGSARAIHVNRSRQVQPLEEGVSLR